MKRVLNSMRKMSMILVLLTIANFCFAQYKLASWNVQNMGKSKTGDKIETMSALLKDFDIIAIQEIVTSKEGEAAVLRLQKSLLKSNKNWKYVVSLPTSSYENKQQSERYAYLWRSDKVQLQKAFLDTYHQMEIEREPFMAFFKIENKIVTIANLHALPKGKQPEKDLKYFKNFPGKYNTENIIFLGDFNTPQTNTVFNPIKKFGWKNALTNEKTTMKQKCVGNECLASEYDNIFYNENHIKFVKSGVIHFYKSMNNDVALARKLSDHLPIFLYFKVLK